MKDARGLILLLITIIYLTLVNSKVFTRCKLAQELEDLQFSRTFISNWVCLIEKVSNKNTSAYTEKSLKRKYYGLFQIGNEWCKEGKQGGKCNIRCEVLLNDDIRDDAACAKLIFEKEGLKYWTKWESRCKGQPLPDVERCPFWSQPPSSRSSPVRSRRLARIRKSFHMSFE